FSAKEGSSLPDQIRARQRDQQCDHNYFHVFLFMPSLTAHNNRPFVSETQSQNPDQIARN
ncbi:MAG TPA: hypothetical protein PKX74_17455, partial [Leptospiraceae bacterium]|nr:hypothetical protein [Leptospiraceae bacterium]